MFEIPSENDFDFINKHLKEQFNTSYTDAPFSRCYVYKENSIILGFILYSLIYDRIELNYIYVDISYRKKGVASKLMQKMIEDGINEKVINITLEVNQNNKYAIKLYEKYNFTIGAIREKYYQNDNAYLMIRELV